MSRFHPFIRTVGTKALVLAWVLESHTSCTTLVDLETLGSPAIRQGILGRWREGFRGMVLVNPITPPKFNMEPENDGFQKESPFPGTSFQVPC